MKKHVWAALSVLLSATASAVGAGADLEESKCFKSQKMAVMTALQKALSDPKQMMAAQKCAASVEDSYLACVKSIASGAATAQGAQEAQAAGTGEVADQKKAASLAKELSAKDQAANALCSQKFSTLAGSCTGIKAQSQVQSYSSQVQKQCGASAANAASNTKNLDQVEKSDEQMGGMPPMSPMSPQAQQPQQPPQEGYQSSSSSMPMMPTAQSSSAANFEPFNFNFPDPDGVNDMNSAASIPSQEEEEKKSPALVNFPGGGNTSPTEFGTKSSLSPEDQLRNILSNFAPNPGTVAGSSSGVPSAGSEAADGPAATGAKSASGSDASLGGAALAGDAGGGGGDITLASSPTPDLTSGPGLVMPSTDLGSKAVANANVGAGPSPEAVKFIPQKSRNNFVSGSVRGPESGLAGVLKQSPKRKPALAAFGQSEEGESSPSLAVIVSLSLMGLLAAGFSLKKYLS